MLPSDAPFLETALALLALLFRPVTASVLLPASPLEGRRLRHARRTSTTTRKTGGLILTLKGSCFSHRVLRVTEFFDQNP